LDFGKSLFRFASIPGNEGLQGKRIATAYPNLVRNFLKSKDLAATVVPLDGAVEGAIKLGVADVIADVVSTGNTLKQAGLQVFGEEILRSEAILIERTGTKRDNKAETMIRRIGSVVIARQYVLVDYDVKKVNLEEACRLTPGLESPTISPLQKDDWVAVRAMVKRSEVHDIMDQLWDLGARGILVTDIHSCRL
jgi:ATP phosphoribosyltransferase